MSHALLSPSSAHRWMRCTMSPHLEKECPDVSTPFIIEGTLAHAYCSKELKKAITMSHDKEDAEIEKFAEYHTPEMDEHVQTYVNIVIDRVEEAISRTIDTRLYVEKDLDLSEYIPRGYGRADAIIVSDKRMEVFDFKYGKGVAVSAKDNEQMMIYALGAYLEYSFEYNIEEISMTIVQPRCNNLSTHVVAVADLLEWADTQLKPKALEAYSGEGTTAAGSWCRFCRARGVCRRLMEESLTTVQKTQNPQLLSNEELARDVLPMLDVVQMWIKAAEETAKERLHLGQRLDGFKLVKSRGRRKVFDAPGLTEWLKGNGFEEDDFLESRTLKSLTAIERLVGKNTFAEDCSKYIVKVDGAPKLVRDDEEGTPIDPASDFD